MNCYYHPGKEGKAQCSICNRNICEECSIPRKNGSSICSRCLVLEAAGDASRGIDDRLVKKEIRLDQKAALKLKRRKVILGVEYGLIIIALVIIAVQAPGLLKVFEDEKPLRHGTYETDSRTDQCLRNLWEISKMLQQGELPGDDIVCPASGKPYEIIQRDSDIVVRSPNPELYGFRDVRVSKLKPVPELVK
jgi:hypothetical protein